MRKRPEILAPAGSWESLMAGVCAGADAVYLGGRRFGARAYADNFSEEELLRAIDYVHLHGRRVYLAVNTLFKDKELDGLYEYLLPYYCQGLDAAIVQDVGAIRYLKERFPKLPLHVSTQASVVHALGAEFFAGLGAARVVPARELSLAELWDMKERTGLEIECFVHGAMCYCYSGQCLLSSMIGGRSGNRGQCAQPCRLPCSVQGKKPQTLLSLKDLCAIELLPELIEAGIDSFKIEGRMKQPEYVYETTKIYRKYTDLYLEQGRGGYMVSAQDRKALEDAYARRGCCTGYYHRQNGREMISFGKPEDGKEENAGKQDYKIKEKISGNLIISKGKRAKLCIEHEGVEHTVRVEVFAEAAQEAQKAPLGRAQVLRQMEKTGDTEFEFAKLGLELDESVFLPVQSLKGLRREGLAKLERQIVSHYRREAPQNMAAELWEAGSLPRVEEHMEAVSYPGAKECVKAAPNFGTGGRAEVFGPSLEVLVADREQLARAVKIEGITTLYIDGSLAFDEEVLHILRRYREAGRDSAAVLCAAMPYIFRKRGISYYETVYEKLARFYDGALIRNWESYMWLRKRGYAGELVSDHNLYVFNQESARLMRQAGVSRYTLPVELNLRELRELCAPHDPKGNHGPRTTHDPEGSHRPRGILIAYGYQPVMVTANCIRRTAGSCEGKNGVLWLTDRMQKKFAVRNDCKSCYNVIYNSDPLMTADMAEQIKALGLSGVRLDFSTEDGERTEKTIRLYRDAFLFNKRIALPDMAYTRGHLKRGVR